MDWSEAKQLLLAPTATYLLSSRTIYLHDWSTGEMTNNRRTVASMLDDHEAPSLQAEEETQLPVSTQRLLGEAPHKESGEGANKTTKMQPTLFIPTL